MAIKFPLDGHWWCFLKFFSKLNRFLRHKVNVAPPLRHAAKWMIWRSLPYSRMHWIWNDPAVQSHPINATFDNANCVMEQPANHSSAQDKITELPSCSSNSWKRLLPHKMFAGVTYNGFTNIQHCQNERTHISDRSGYRPTPSTLPSTSTPHYSPFVVSLILDIDFRIV